MNIICNYSPGIPFSHARERLLLLTTYDNSYKPLTQEILERPRLVDRIRRALRPGKSYIVCFNSTHLEQELSVKLGVPLFAASPDLSYWGSKSGSQCNFCRLSNSSSRWQSIGLDSRGANSGSCQIMETATTAPANGGQTQRRIFR